MLTSNILHRVLKLRVVRDDAQNSSTGTAFTIEHDGRQYVVTANHVLGPLQDIRAIECYMQEEGWVEFPLALTGRGPEADVAVLAPSWQLTPAFPLAPTSAGLICGQDVHFLGFPYTILPSGAESNHGRPLPLVKRACVSAFIDGDPTCDYLLDGFSNPGFSGAPVVFHPAGTTGNELRLLGIVTGHRETHYGQNTGIIVGSDIRHALNLIRSNPNGFPIPPDAPSNK